MALRLSLGIVLLVVTTEAADAHHSYTEFDAENTREIEGTLLAAAWVNPHANLTVKANDGTTWDIQTSAVNYLRRAAAPLELFQVGSIVKVAGWPSKKTDARMYGTNILSAARAGTDLVSRATAVERHRVGEQSARADLNDGARRQATIFRVWDVVYTAPGEPVDPDTAPGALRRVPWPLTDAALKAVAAFDLVNQSTAVGCEPKGMPQIMYAPVPLEFVQENETILLRIEEYDTVRRIHLERSADAASQPKTPLGYSVGRWDGETLVVETTNVSAKYLSDRGAPLGPSAKFLERFTPSADGSRLHYSILITDPYSLTEPTEQKRSWVASADEVLPFNCSLSNGARPR